MFFLRNEGLTRAGQPLAGQVLGLRRYPEHFSDFTDRGVPDLALWDKYLVYAAAFGISAKVITQLAIVYPEVEDSQWLEENASGSLVYWSYLPHRWYRSDDMSHNISQGFEAGSFSAQAGDLGAQLTSSFADLSRTIRAAAPSSSNGSSAGSFSGGSFSGSSGGSGGGSFGGR